MCRSVMYSFVLVMILMPCVSIAQGSQKMPVKKLGSSMYVQKVPLEAQPRNGSIVLEKPNGDIKHDRHMRVMALADANKDGIVTLDELKTYRLRWLQQNIIMDRTKDGIIDERDLGPNQAGQNTLSKMGKGSAVYPSQLAKPGSMYRDPQFVMQQLNRH